MMILKSRWFHLLGMIGLLGFLVVLRLPIYINWETFLQGDDAFLALHTIEMIQGKRFFLYHEGAMYLGILSDLAAIPFLWGLGLNPLAYSIPGIIFYSLYIWTSFRIVKKVNAEAAGLALFLLVFASPTFLEFSTRNFPHHIMIFLGNLMFLQFMRIRESGTSTPSAFLALGFLIGLSIYNYSLIFVHVAVLVMVFVLTHPAWEKWRGTISLSLITRSFKNLETKKALLIRILDLVIIGFIVAILFAFVWGGFGFKFSGMTLLQINDLHKAMLQFLILLLLRFLLDRHSLQGHCQWLLEGMKRISENALLKAGGIGFLTGIAPRLISILTGETTGGGQGFHLEFNPLLILRQTRILISDTLPEAFGVWNPRQWAFAWEQFSAVPENMGRLVPVVLNTAVTGLILCAGGWFISSRWEDIKKIIQFKHFQYSPVVLILLYPSVMFFLAMLGQGLPASRYFFVVNGMVLIWVALYLDHIRKQSVAVFTALLLAWSGFHLLNTYKFYATEDVMHGFKIQKRHQPLMEVIEFCNTNNIKTAYGGWNTTYITTFLSAGSLTVAEYFHDREVRGKILKEKTLADPEFAVITKIKERTDLYRAYLENKKIGFKEKQIGIYTIFWNFSGPGPDVDRLRRLI